MKFSDFKLNDTILDALFYMNFEEATEIQEKAIPTILEGKDLIGCAQTGTGKTAAFVLPTLNQIADAPSDGVQVLILCPTRELAIQIDQQIQGIAYFTNASCYPVYGGGDGVSWEAEADALKGGADIIVATPGRLMAHMARGYVKFDTVKHLILDEADRMLDMGFIPDIKKIFESTSQDQQVLMFTATLNKQIEKIAQQFLKDPQRIAIEQENKSNKNIQQIAYPVADYNQKKLVLVDVLNEPDLKEAIIVTATKREADRLSDELYLMNHRSKTLHGDMSQRERTRTINRFKNNEIQILVATDVAARGIDVDDITHVINFDLPRQVEDYIHRIGRTGRADRKGKAISLVVDKEKFMLQKIEKYANIKIEIIKSTHSTSDVSLVYKKKESGFKKKRRSSAGGKKNDKFSASSKRKKPGFKADAKTKAKAKAKPKLKPRRRPVNKNSKPQATAS